MKKRLVSEEELHANMRRGTRTIFFDEPTDLDEMLRKSLDITNLKDFIDTIALNNLREKMGWKDYDEEISYTKLELHLKGGIYKSGLIFSKDGEHFAPGTYYYTKKDGSLGIGFNPKDPINSKYYPGDGKTWFHGVRRTIMLMEQMLDLKNVVSGEVLIVTESKWEKSWGLVVERFKDYYTNINVSIRDNIEKLGVDINFINLFGVESIKDAKRGDLNGVFRRLENNPDIKINNFISIDSRGDEFSYKLCPNCRNRNKLGNISCSKCGATLAKKKLNKDEIIQKEKTMKSKIIFSEIINNFPNRIDRERQIREITEIEDVIKFYTKEIEKNEFWFKTLKSAKTKENATQIFEKFVFEGHKDLLSLSPYYSNKKHQIGIFEDRSPQMFNKLNSISDLKIEKCDNCNNLENENNFFKCRNCGNWECLKCGCERLFDNTIPIIHKCGLDNFETLSNIGTCVHCGNTIGFLSVPQKIRLQIILKSNHGLTDLALGIREYLHTEKKFLVKEFVLIFRSLKQLIQDLKQQQGSPKEWLATYEKIKSNLLRLEWIVSYILNSLDKIFKVARATKYDKISDKLKIFYPIINILSALHSYAFGMLEKTITPSQFTDYISNFLAYLSVSKIELQEWFQDKKENLKKLNDIAEKSQDRDVIREIAPIINDLFDEELIENVLNSWLEKLWCKNIESYSSFSENDIDLLSEEQMLLIEGKKYNKSGNMEKANQYFNDALKINNEFKDAWYWLGVTAHNQGNFSEAIEYYEKALELDPKNQIFWRNIADCYIKEDKMTEALDPLEKILEIDPINQEALQLREWIKRLPEKNKNMKSIREEKKNDRWNFMYGGELKPP